MSQLIFGPIVQQDFSVEVTDYFLISKLRVSGDAVAPLQGFSFMKMRPIVSSEPHCV